MKANPCPVCLALRGAPCHERGVNLPAGAIHAGRLTGGKPRRVKKVKPLLDGREPWGGKLCRCGGCELEAVCVLYRDFYALNDHPEAWLLCELCICVTSVVARRKLAFGVPLEASEAKVIAELSAGDDVQ